MLLVLKIKVNILSGFSLKNRNKCLFTLKCIQKYKKKIYHKNFKINFFEKCFIDPRLNSYGILGKILQDLDRTILPNLCKISGHLVTFLSEV